MVDENLGTFAFRLIAALDQLEIEPDQREAFVASAAGVTRRTARRYLSCKSASIRSIHVFDLSEKLEVDFSWLHRGTDTLDAKAANFLFLVGKMPEHRQSQMARFIMAFRNKSGKAERLLNQVNSGQLDLNQVLDLYG